MSLFVTLASGTDFHFANATPAMVRLDDIVHHLSRENRWYNNVEPVSFTVAQHSMLVVAGCRLRQSEPYALLHDAPEMVTRDLASPFKDFLLTMGADIRAYETNLLRTVFYPAFGLPQPSAEIEEDVARADAIALATEHRDIVKGRNPSWAPTAKPLSVCVRFMPQPKVEERFRLQLERALRPFGKVA